MRLSIKDKISVSACCYSVKDMDIVFPTTARNRGALYASISNVLRSFVDTRRTHKPTYIIHPLYFHIKVRVEKPSGEVYYLKPFYIDLQCNFSVIVIVPASL